MIPTEALAIKHSSSLPECDSILTKDGHWIIATIEKVSEAEILYSECQGVTDRKHAIPMQNVKLVRSKTFGARIEKTLHGMPTDFDMAKDNASPDNRIIHPMARWSLTFGIAALLTVFLFFPLSLILMVLAMALGFAALKRIRREKSKYKGKGEAIAGIIIGFVFIGVILGFVVEAMIYGID